MATVVVVVVVVVVAAVVDRPEHWASGIVMGRVTGDPGTSITVVASIAVPFFRAVRTLRSSGTSDRIETRNASSVDSGVSAAGDSMIRIDSALVVAVVVARRLLDLQNGGAVEGGHRGGGEGCREPPLSRAVSRAAAPMPNDASAAPRLATS